MTLSENPFHVLGVALDCSALEAERAGQKWLGLLEVGVGAAKTYASPVGARPRTPEAVRQAMADLRDPARRLVAELLYVEPGDPAAPAAGWPAVDPDPDAFRELGWRR